jgi:pyruvate dehydrogenase E2 component (dihydrolipoamide acetyltransferase)
MAIEIFMPKLGWTMEEGVLDEWIKQDGDAVQAGDIIFVVESDKALQEIEAFDSGILRILPDAPPVGSTVQIGELLAYLVQPGEEAPFERLRSSAANPQSGAQVQADDGRPAISAPPVKYLRKPGRDDQPAISPRAKRVASELGIDWTSIAGSGRSGRIVERDVRAAAQLMIESDSDRKLRITPVARRVALDSGLSLDVLEERFAGGRVTRADVEGILAEEPTTPSAKRQTMSPVRRLTRDRMIESARAAVPVTITSEVDATELVQMRRKLKTDGSAIVPSVNDLMTKLVAAALDEHPALNTSIDGDDLVLHDLVNIALAVDTERGLLTPVIRNVNHLSLLEVAAVSADLVEQARRGRIKSEDLQSATFTISNLGMYDIDAFTPIIHLPQCAILGVGRIVARQVVVDVDAERLAIRHMMALSLTFDHRAVDGAPAARFLQRVKQYVETPYLWLVN